MTARRVAWFLFVTLLVSQAAAAVLFFMHFPVRMSAASLPVPVHIGGMLLPLFVGALGLLIVQRAGGHTVAWTLIASGVALALMSFVEHYALQGLQVDPGSLPGALWIGWFGNIAGPVMLWVPMILLLAWFPTGRVPTPRWRIALGFLAIACGLMFLGSFAPARVMDIPGTRTPIALRGNEGLIQTAGNFAWLFMMIALLLAAASLVVRTVRSRGVERQQLKIVGVSAATVVLGAVLSLLSGLAPQWIGSAVDLVAPFLIGAGLVSLPIAVTVALLRYRLYDVDVIINRALVYGALTLGLASLYVASVIVLGYVLGPLTRDSDVAVAASTLAIAAAFRPLRSKTQSFIDKRFYRRRYDAARSVASFSSRLRDEVDLEVTTLDLIGVVKETVQPRSVSLWVAPGRPSGAGS